MQRNAGVNVGDGNFNFGRSFRFYKKQWIAIKGIRGKIQIQETRRYMRVVGPEKSDIDDARFRQNRRGAATLIVWRRLRLLKAPNGQIEQFDMARKWERRLST
ncbi:hypothetical protein [Vibrio cyclitrophicus]|uniref:hypothetical protein n=1 Tax=Vibrio cyclitrophicus TaxID=47951 RepID=UPI00080DCAE9|nr:hypothetical protein [Vibrio cyclitrophicus]OCH44298.1 hypothetical protein A6E07_20275 [Vibrio cyclitrophicus]